jgi:hypothetical protein
MHDRLAREIYEKVIPEEHRYTLPVLDPESRYAFIKDVLDAMPTTQALTIRQLFDDYGGLRAALPGRLRQLLSFQSWLRAVVADKKLEGVPQELVLRRLWEAALNDPELPHPVAERLGDWMIWSSRGVRLRVEGTLALSLGPETITIHSLPNGSKIHVGRNLRVTAVLDGNEMLPDAVVGCLLAVFDLGRSGLLRAENLPTTTINVKDFCSVEAFVPGKLIRIGWPMPPWQEFHRYIKFAERWAEAIPAPTEGTTIDATDLARRYIAAIIDDVLGSIAAEQATATGWESLSRMVARLAITLQTDGSKDPALLAWARSQASLLAAPEGGLPAEAANVWLEEFRAFIEKGANWDNVKNELLYGRRSNVGRASGLPISIGNRTSALELTISELDKQSPTHAWRGVVEADPENLLGRLWARFRGIGVVSSLSSTLLDYVTRSRQEEFRVAPPEVLDQLLASIRRITKHPGQLGTLAIDRLWKVATRDESNTMQQLINTTDSGSLHINAETAIQHLGRPYLDRGSASLIFGSDRDDRMSLRLGYARIAWDHESSKPWLRALYRIALDLHADASPDKPGVLHAWWAPAGGDRSIGYPPIPWPAVAWPALVDWERMMDAWNNRIIPEVSAGAEDARVANSNVDLFGDAAAYWFICATMHFLDHRCDLEDVQFELIINPTRWTEKIAWCEQHIRNRRAEPKQPARYRAFLDWFQSIGLFAAPESGLTVNAADAIINSVPDIAQKAPYLITLRRERLRLPGTDEAAIDRMITTINARFPNHPWMERIERPYLSSQTSG